MSAIQKEIEKVLKTKQGKKEEFDEYLERLVDDSAEDLSDDEFGGLSKEAQRWLNAGTTALDKKKPVANFPDAEGEEEEDEKPAKKPAKKGRGKKAKVEPEEEPEPEDEPEVEVEEEEEEPEAKPEKKKASAKKKTSTKATKKEAETKKDKKAPAKKEVAEVHPSKIAAEKVRVLIAQKPNKSCKEIVEICETKGIELNPKSVSNEYSRMHKVLRTLTSKGLIELKGYKG